MKVDAKVTFSTPADAPLVPTFPFAFRDVVILSALYRTDREQITELLPAPLEAAGDTVVIHIYQMNDTDWFGSYYESAVQVASVYPPTGERGAYSPYLFLDNDGAIAAGREVYGQPKKYGRPRIEVRQDLVVGTVSRNEIDVATLTMPYKSQASSRQEMLDAFDFVSNFNLKVLPEIDGSDGMRQLTSRELVDLRVHECWTGPGTVELRPSAQAPFHRLPVREMLQAFYWRCDFVLDHGRVLHDYRGNGGAPAAPEEGEG